MSDDPKYEILQDERWDHGPAHYKQICCRSCGATRFEAAVTTSVTLETGVAIRCTHCGWTDTL